MAFVIVEWQDEGGISLINEKWLTPKKKEVLWPPHKKSSTFNKALKEHESPDETWEIHAIKRCMYQSGMYLAFTPQYVGSLALENRWFGSGKVRLPSHFVLYGHNLTFQTCFSQTIINLGIKHPTLKMFINEANTNAAASSHFSARFSSPRS